MAIIADVTTGELIKGWRKKANLTQEQLAEAAGMTRSYIADCEGNRNSPSVRQILRFIDAIEKRFIHFGEEENERLVMFFLGPDVAGGGSVVVASDAHQLGGRRR